MRNQWETRAHHLNAKFINKGQDRYHNPLLVMIMVNFESKLIFDDVCNVKNEIIRNQKR